LNWFRPVRPLFRPASIAGWLISLAALAFCIQTFAAIDRNSHSVSDTLYGIVPFWLPTMLALA
jgi:hypothetical protein